jgi:hypothetical protein
MIAKSGSGKIEEALSTQDKDWKPKFLFNFLIPAFAPSGEYKIVAKGHDEVGNTVTSVEVRLTVRGKDVQPSDVLTARNLRFLKTDQDGTGFNPAIYRPGETLWARFEITGFKYGENNRFAVEYGLAIQNESGQQVFEHADAAAESNESFYPQRYVPGAVSLNLDPNVPPGDYTLVILMRDKAGDQMTQTKGMFRIEPAGAQ